MSILKNLPLYGASLPMALLMAGCATHLSPAPVATAGAIPSVLLRSSQMASHAQQRVSEVLFVQTHPPVIAVAPSQKEAISDRFNFHWEGSVNVVALNLASAMGWSLEFKKPQPLFMPYVYVDQHNSDARKMVSAINRQIMPTAMLRLDPKDRKLVLQVPTRTNKLLMPAVKVLPVKSLHHKTFSIPAQWFRNAKNQKHSSVVASSSTTPP